MVLVGEVVGEILGKRMLAAVGEAVVGLTTLRRAGFDAGAGTGAAVGVGPLALP